MTNPFVRVSMTALGQLQVELPGAADSQRPVVLRSGEEAETLKRILVARLALHYAIGEDGAPTQSQVTHWERHGVWPDERCPHCVAEGRGASNGTRRRSTTLAEYGGVTVRRVERARAKALVAEKSSEEMGL